MKFAASEVAWASFCACAATRSFMVFCCRVSAANAACVASTSFWAAAAFSGSDLAASRSAWAATTATWAASTFSNFALSKTRMLDVTREVRRVGFLEVRRVGFLEPRRPGREAASTSAAGVTVPGSSEHAT